LIGDFGGRRLGRLDDYLPFLRTQNRWLNGFADQFRAVGLAASALQAEAEICWQSWYTTPPSMTKVRNPNLTPRLPQVLAWQYTTASGEKLGVNQRTVGGVEPQDMTGQDLAI
jgi:hypothetical protein